MKTPAKNVWLALASGYVLTFYSEFAFYGQFNDPGSPPPDFAGALWLLGVYTLMAYLLLAGLRVYRVDGLPALLVLGAAYGWALEGGIVATVYENLPWSLSFTGLAWHMPIDVLFGWYFVQKWLREESPSFNLRAAFVTGLVWGGWAVWPAEVEPLHPLRFAFFALATTAALLAAYWLLGRLNLNTFHPTRPGMWLAGSLFLLFYLLNTAWVVPLSGILLPLLLGICGWALRRHAENNQDAPDVLAQLSAAPRKANLLAWLLFPLVAASEYALWAFTGWKVPSNIIGYLLTVPLGFFLFGWALWRLGRSRGGL